MRTLQPLIQTWIRIRAITAIGMAAGLAACGHIQPASHQDLLGDSPTQVRHAADAAQQLQGQLSIKLEAWQNTPAKGVSLGFFFTGRDQEGLLDLLTPLGTLMSQVGWRPDAAWLTTQDGRRDYPNLEALTQETLGEPLPLQSLMHWVAGQPNPMEPSEPGVESGTFTQAGWLIDARQLPQQKLQAQRPASAQQRGIQIKVYLDQ